MPILTKTCSSCGRREGDSAYEEDEGCCDRQRLRSNVVFAGVRAITIGDVDRCYGGPEEGGWWYDDYVPRRVFLVRADAYDRHYRRLQGYVARQNVGRRELGSVLSDGRIFIADGVVERTRRPQYE